MRKIQLETELLKNHTLAGSRQSTNDQNIPVSLLFFDDVNLAA